MNNLTRAIHFDLKISSESRYQGITGESIHEGIPKALAQPMAHKLDVLLSTTPPGKATKD